MLLIKNCPQCGAEQSYKRKDHYNHAVKTNRVCRKCSNSDLNNCGHKGFHEEIAVSFFNKFRASAIARDKEFNITIEDVWNLYLAQGKICALSGKPIEFSGKATGNTVSIDRIDNSLGYTHTNIQLLDRQVNMMKHALGQEEFISICNSITNHIR